MLSVLSRTVLFEQGLAIWLKLNAFRDRKYNRIYAIHPVMRCARPRLTLIYSPFGLFLGSLDRNQGFVGFVGIVAVPRSVDRAIVIASKLCDIHRSALFMTSFYVESPCF